MALNVPTPKRILVSGATGRQGGGVVKALAYANSLLPASSPNAYTILAITRNAQSPKAQRLLSLRGVELVEGNLNDSTALFKAAGGPVHGVFSVQQGADNPEGGIKGEVRQAKALADSAKAAGVKHFVYASVDFGGVKDTKVAYFETKREIEAYIHSLGLPCTVLGITGLMDSYLNEDSFETKIYATVTTRSTYSHPETQTLQLIACEDIGSITVYALEHPDEYIGKTLAVAADEPTITALTETYRTLTGRKMPTTSTLLIGTVKLFMKPLARMCEFFDEHGFRADIPALRRTFPEMKTWEEFVQTHMVKT